MEKSYVLIHYFIKSCESSNNNNEKILKDNTKNLLSKYKQKVLSKQVKAHYICVLISSKHLMVKPAE